MKSPLAFPLLLSLLLAGGTASAEGASSGSQARSSGAGSSTPTTDDDTKPAPGPPPESPSKCVKHTTQARFVSGYDHLVHLQNDCKKQVVCKVSTDVNPEVQTATLAPSEKKTVLTYRGSPARDFKAKVECSFSGTKN